VINFFKPKKKKKKEERRRSTTKNKKENSKAGERKRNDLRKKTNFWFRVRKGIQISSQSQNKNQINFRRKQNREEKKKCLSFCKEPILLRDEEKME
jgi:hypothetical protein